MEDNRIAELHHQLIEERDPVCRAQLHMELGELAIRDGRLVQAARHFEEALFHDKSLHVAHEALRSLGHRHTPTPPGRIQSLMQRFRLRRAA